jgi:hypothetical protein
MASLDVRMLRLLSRKHLTCIDPIAYCRGQEATAVSLRHVTYDPAKNW